MLRCSNAFMGAVPLTDRHTVDVGKLGSVSFKSKAHQWLSKIPRNTKCCFISQRLAGRNSTFRIWPQFDRCPTWGIRVGVGWGGSKVVPLEMSTSHSCQYGCERWTLTADLGRRIQAFENKCYRRMIGISDKEHKTNKYVWQQVNILGGHQQLLLSTVKRRRFSWFDHVCHHDTLPKIIRQGTLVGSPRKSWREASRTGQASQCCRCCASQTAEVDGRPLQWRGLLLGRYGN